jgi:hypothetical protein
MLKANPLNHFAVLCLTVRALFIIMKNLSNQMSNNRSSGKINTVDFNAAICWRRIFFHHMRKCWQYNQWKKKAGFQNRWGTMMSFWWHQTYKKKKKMTRFIPKMLKVVFSKDKLMRDILFAIFCIITILYKQYCKHIFPFEDIN